MCYSFSTRCSVRLDMTCWQIKRHEEISSQVAALHRPVSENREKELNTEERLWMELFPETFFCSAPFLIPWAVHWRKKDNLLTLWASLGSMLCVGTLATFWPRDAVRVFLWADEHPTYSDQRFHRQEMICSNCLTWGEFNRVVFTKVLPWHW